MITRALARGIQQLQKDVLARTIKTSKSFQENLETIQPLGRYIVDFNCKSLNLVIEIDGSYHFEEEQKINDEQRQKILE